MLPEEYRWIVDQFEPEGDPQLLAAIARHFEDEGNLEAAATVYDRAFGLDPEAAEVRQRRQRVLDRLAVTEHGIHFRYVPGGSFLMGQSGGDPDEGPWHPVWLAPFWMSETPISWGAYCRLMDWEPPTSGGCPRDMTAPAEGFDRQRFYLYNTNKLRWQYCEDHTTRAVGWHAHYPRPPQPPAPNPTQPPRPDPRPPREPADAPWEYEAKPIIAVGWQEATELAERLTTPKFRYLLPTEAQWEKAARGGLIGARHPWGDAPPTRDRCDFGRFTEFSILPSKTFPPNDYGLYAMSGGVWEWTRDWYDSAYYRDAPAHDPEGPATGGEKVLRGGSWADCAEVVTVTYRMSRGSGSWRDGEWGRHMSPNIGFRLCRTVMLT
jgi:formylglycine-generating enzyme required for sulfatase activity